MTTSTCDFGATSLRDVFAGAHDHIDRTFERFRDLKRLDFARAAAAFRAFRRALEHHMRCEEEVLSGAIERQIASEYGPTVIMHAEHRCILDALDSLEARIAAGDAECDEEEAALVELLEAHNLKEDRALYPIVDRMLSGNERRNLLDRIDRVPVEGSPRCCA